MLQAVDNGLLISGVAHDLVLSPGAGAKSRAAG
jgi:hypothetical protein